MRKPLDIIEKIKELLRASEELKTAQPITGDSWIPYRYTGTVPIPATSARYVVFTQNDATKPAVVKIGQNLGFHLQSTGVRSQNGISYFVYRNDNPGAVEYDYVLSTTQEGVVSISSTPPF